MRAIVLLLSFTMMMSSAVAVAKGFDKMLTRAAKTGRIDVMERAIGYGARDFNQALLAAIKHDQLAAISLIIESGEGFFHTEDMYNFKYALGDGLEAAAGKGKLEAMRLIIKSGKNILGSEDEFKDALKLNQALDKAARKGDLAAMRLALNNGADLDLAFGNAAAFGNIGGMKLITEHRKRRLDKDETSSFRSSFEEEKTTKIDCGYAFVVAAECDQFNAMEFLIDYKMKHYTAFSSKDYLKNELELNNAFMWTAGNGNNETTKLVIEHGANNFDEALAKAAGGGHIDTMTLIIERGRDKLKVVDFDKALAEAAGKGKLEAMKFLIKHGAQDFDKALAAAARWYGDIEAMEIAIEYGAQDFDKALVEAAVFAHGDAMRLLIKHGAQDFTKALVKAASYARHYRYNDKGEIVLNADEESHRIEAMELLIKHGGANSLDKALQEHLEQKTTLTSDFWEKERVMGIIDAVKSATHVKHAN